MRWLVVFVVIIIILACILIPIHILFNGVFGFFSGYGGKAQEFTSAEYSIEQYKFFIDKYNAIRQMGSMIQNMDYDIERFENKIGDDPHWRQSDQYQEMIFVRNGYIQQYNRFVAEYNARMRDLTTNQMWMKPQNYPSSLDFYVKGKVVTLDNDPLELPEL